MSFLNTIYAHVWILYIFLLNGFLISQALQVFSFNYRSLVDMFETRILSYFFISITLNFFSLFILNILELEFMYMRYLLPTISSSLILCLSLLIFLKKIELRNMIPEFGYFRFFLYSFVFIILSYNGGLIEQIADSWFHMSYANKIEQFNSFDVKHHLNGIFAPPRQYPLLWHSNLAILSTVSEISLPVLWNAFTPWGGCLKVMGFFLLAFGISKRKDIATLSTFLFIMLPGLGNSYLRVSAWPAHISYTAWFCLFYVTFLFFDKCSISKVHVGDNSAIAFLNHFILTLKQNFALILSFLLLATIIFLTHKVELVWFASGILFYSMVLTFYQLFTNCMGDYTEPASWLLKMYLFLALIGVAFFSLKTYKSIYVKSAAFQSELFLFLLISFILVAFIYFMIKNSFLNFIYNKNISKTLMIIMVVVLFLSIDFKQLLSLFVPELGYPNPKYAELPIITKGWLGEQLILPSWNMQLRNGFLYSGILAIITSVVMAVIKPDRSTLFLAANAAIPFLFFISPYLYQWITDILNYHSLWRIGLLVFHPIILAVFLHYLWQIIFDRDLTLND